MVSRVEIRQALLENSASLLYCRHITLRVTLIGAENPMITEIKDIWVKQNIPVLCRITQIIVTMTGAIKFLQNATTQAHISVKLSLNFDSPIVIPIRNIAKGESNAAKDFTV